MAKALFLKLIFRFFYLCARSIDGNDAEPMLVIAPHPDDESLGCGLALARSVDAGAKVRVIIITDSSPEPIADRRREEATEAVQALGLQAKDVVFLGIPDTKASEHIDRITEALRCQIAEFGPRRVYSPYGIDLGPDHVAVAEAVHRLCRDGTIRCPVYEYPVWFTVRQMFRHLFTPSLLLSVRCHTGRKWLPKKSAAIRSHRSQYAGEERSERDAVLSERFIGRFLYGFELFFEKSRDL